MIIECPHCQARLNLPAYVAGKQVRCAICRQMFLGDLEALKESVQTGSPDSAAVTPKPRDVERPRAKTRHFEDEGDHDDHLDSRDFSPDRLELIENAKSQARPAAYAMLAAFFLTAVMLLEYLVMTIATRNMGFAQGPEEAALISFCGLLFYAPMLIFIGVGVRSLFTLGSRGLVVTAIVMNFIVFSIFFCGVLLNTVLGTWAPVDWMSIATSSVSSLANLTAAVMALRVLTFREVADAYAARAEEQRRRY
jgi:hypothetical protein